ncbi:MAG: hypothetical protein MJZ00_03110 [Paludibacteraceae bacterium]|nr:hypothetical protein [Paludibacteraceae bacterium]
MLLQGCAPKKEASEENVLIITNTEEYLSFVSDYNTGKFHINDSLMSPLSVSLENDITIVDEHLSPIGSEEFPFIGIFNGNGHTITCCGIGKSEAANNVGLIGYAVNSKITGVNVVTDMVVGYRNVGIICGYAYRTCLNDCKTRGNVSGVGCCGGIVGIASYGGISDCYFEGDVTSSGCLAGGIAGLLEFGGIQRSYAEGNVSAKRGVSSMTSSYQDGVMISECKENVNCIITSKEDSIKRRMVSDKLTRLLFQM